MKYWCQIIVIYSYIKTESKPHKYVPEAYENCSQLTLYLLEGGKKKAYFNLLVQNL